MRSHRSGGSHRGHGVRKSASAPQLARSSAKVGAPPRSSSQPKLPPLVPKPVVAQTQGQGSEVHQSVDIQASRESLDMQRAHRAILEVLSNPDVKHIAKKYYKAGLEKSGSLGALSFSDLKRVLRSLRDRLGLPSHTEDAAQKLFKRFDFNHDNELSFDEFFELFLSSLRRMAFQQTTLVGRDFFVSKQTGSVWDMYEPIKELGAGTFGSASLARNRKSGEDRVVKVVKKSQVKLPMEDIEREILVMRQIDHPHVVRLFEWYEDKTKLFLVLEALKGGNLREVLLEFHNKGKALTEDWVRTATKQMVEAMAYCHSFRVIHKDLKDENVMLVKQESSYDKPFVVIIDLGCAEMFSTDDPHGKAMGGTPITMAPEVWLNNFGPKCDVWSLGCILFEMLTGALPFDGRTLNPKDWIALHKRGPDWAMIKTSKQGRELCQRMLTVSDRKRPTMNDCLRHEWFAADAKALSSVDPKKFDNLKRFAEASSVTRALLLEVAARLPMSRAANIVEVFQAFDDNADAVLSFKELKAAMAACGLKDENLIKQLFRAMDQNSDGMLSFSEFAAGVILTFKDLLNERLQAFFVEYDKDRDGFLTREETQALLANAMQLVKGDKSGAKAIDKMLSSIFSEGNSKASYKELQATILGFK